jgi:putative peptidoglycan lipid II flippase
MGQLVKSTVIVTIFNTLGIILGFISNLIIASVFGAGKSMDIYMAATALPMFIISLISGLLSITFIPVFAEYKNSSEKWNITSSILNIIVIITIIITIVIFIFSRSIISFFIPGFSSEKVAFAASLLRLQIPIIILVAINELMAGVYYSNSQFVTPFFNKIFSPIITIGIVLAFNKALDVYGLIIASLLAMFVQTGMLILGFYRTKEFHYQLIFDFRNSGVKKILKLMIPLLAGMLFYRIMPLFDRYIGSSLPEGCISYIGYSYKIYSQIAPIISTGIAMSIFPILSTLAAENNLQGIRHNMSKAIKLLLFLSLPIVFIIFFYGLPVVQLLFERGKISHLDSINISNALALYILALPVAVVGDITSKGYYILKDTITPAIVGVFELLIYFITAILFYRKIGFLALPLAYAIYMNFSAINILIVRKKLGNTGGRSIVKTFFNQLLICIFSFGIFYFPICLIDNLYCQNIFILLSLLFYFIISLFIAKSPEAFFIYVNIRKFLVK